MMADSSEDCCRVAERFCLRALLVSCCFLLFWFVLMLLAWDWMVGIHAAMMRSEEPQMAQFAYDAKMLNYLLMGVFKLAAFLLFLIPWLVLRVTSD